MVEKVGLRRFCPYEPPREKKFAGAGKTEVFAAFILGGMVVAGLSWWALKKRSGDSSVSRGSSDSGGASESSRGIFIKKMAPVKGSEERVLPHRAVEFGQDVQPAQDVEILPESWAVVGVPLERSLGYLPSEERVE